jgi:hypothetical protein
LEARFLVLSAVASRESMTKIPWPGEPVSEYFTEYQSPIFRMNATERLDEIMSERISECVLKSISESM